MAGNRIATGFLCVKAETTKDRVNKNEKGKRKLFLFKCCQSISLGQYYCHVYKFEIQRKRETKKDKEGNRPEKLNEKKSDRQLQRAIKGQTRHFFVGRTT